MITITITAAISEMALMTEAEPEKDTLSAPCGIENSFNNTSCESLRLDNEMLYKAKNYLKTPEYLPSST